MKQTCIFFFIVLILCPFSSPISVAQGQPLQILSITGDTLTARFELPELQIKVPPLSSVEGETPYQKHPQQKHSDSRLSAGMGTEIHFAGADWTLDVGKPRLPVYAQCIGIPIAGTPIVTVIQTRSEVRGVENVPCHTRRSNFSSFGFPIAPYFTGILSLETRGAYPQRVYPRSARRQPANQPCAVQLGYKTITDIRLRDFPH